MVSIYTRFPIASILYQRTSITREAFENKPAKQFFGKVVYTLNAMLNVNCNYCWICCCMCNSIICNWDCSSRIEQKNLCVYGQAINKIQSCGTRARAMHLLTPVQYLTTSSHAALVRINANITAERQTRTCSEQDTCILVQHAHLCYGAEWLHKARILSAKARLVDQPLVVMAHRTRKAKMCNKMTIRTKSTITGEPLGQSCNADFET